MKFTSKLGYLFPPSKENIVRFMPVLNKDSRIIIPISMTRYDSTPDKIKKYDERIAEILTYTAEKLDSGDIASVEVVSSAGLQEINWGKEKSYEIDKHFFKTHKEILSMQSAFYTWHEFIDKIGENKVEKNYELIKSESLPTSRWHYLMVKSQKTISLDATLEHSLEYQRKEYGLILSLAGLYTNIAYYGFISPAWAYLYKVHALENLPTFTQITLEKFNNYKYIKKGKSESTVDIVIGSVHEALASSELSANEKEKLYESIESLMYTYQLKNFIIYH